MVVKNNGKRFVFILLVVTLIALMMGNVCAEDVNGTNVDTITPTKSINVDVNYEYANDNNNVIPDFYIYSGEDKIEYNKELVSSNRFVLTFKDNSSNGYNITALTAGYISQSQIISDSITFNLKASDAYKLGRDVTADADRLLDFKTADDILVVTTAGVTKLNGKSTEDALEAILNYGTKIKYSNVLMLRDTAVNPIDFAFIVKRGNELKAVIYENGSRSYSYLGTISENMTREQWNNYIRSIHGQNAWSFASLANGWVAGVSREVLQEAAFHGHICEGTLGGYSIVKALIKYYPPVQETLTGGGSPADVTSYKILGVPGGSDDDAVLFFLDATIGKTSYVGIDTTATGATENMLGFIRWDAKSLSGDLIIMSFDSKKIKADFKAETGINADAGSLEELKYCTWWINKINKNPEELATFLYEFTNLTEEQYYYLMGTAKSVVHGNVSIAPVESHGLDLKYILSLNLPKATRTVPSGESGSLSDEEMKNIGFEAYNKASAIFKDELNINLGKDNVDLGIFTSAGYVYLNGKETVAVRDGLYEIAGATLYSKNLLQYHQALWKPLWFTFILRNPNSDVLYSVYLRYNPDGTWFVGELNGSNVVDIGIETLNSSAKVKAIQKTFMPDKNWNNIQSIANAWKSNPNFDQIMVFLYHNHVCPGVQPGFFITDYIQQNHPLGENESYNYIASSTYCKDDSLTYLLGVSPGMGTYFVQKLPNSDVTSTYVDGATDEGALVIWDNNLNIGRVVIVSFKWPTIDTSMYATSEAKRAAQIQAFIDLYKGINNPNVLENFVVKTSEEKWITAEQFNLLKSGSGELNTMAYIKSLDGSVTKEDLLKQLEKNNNSNTNANTNTNTNSNSNSNVDENSHSSASSAGVSNNRNMPQSSNSNVGDSNNALDPSSADLGSDDGKSYEVSKKSPAKSINPDYMPYVVIVILIVGILVGVGYMKHRK